MVTITTNRPAEEKGKEENNAKGIQGDAGKFRETKTEVDEHYTLQG
jgi:hypothetical protein